MERAELEQLGGTQFGVNIDFGNVNDDGSDVSSEPPEEKPSLWQRVFNSAYLPIPSFARSEKGEELISMASHANDSEDEDDMEIVSVGLHRPKKWRKWLPCIAACCCLSFVTLYLIIVLAVISHAGKQLDIEYSGGAALFLTCNDKQKVGGDFKLTGLVSGLGLSLEEVDFYFSNANKVQWAKMGPIDNLAFSDTGAMRVEGEVIALSMSGMQDFLNRYLNWRINDVDRPVINLKVKGWIKSKLLPFPLPLSLDTEIESPHTDTFVNITAVDIDFADTRLNISVNLNAHGYYVWNTGVPFSFDVYNKSGEPMAHLMNITTGVLDGGKYVNIASPSVDGAAFGKMLAEGGLSSAVFSVRGISGECLPQKIVSGLNIEVPMSHIIKEASGNATGPLYQVMYNAGTLQNFSENAFVFKSDIAVSRVGDAALCSDAVTKKCDCDEYSHICTAVPEKGMTDAGCQQQCHPPDLPISLSGSPSVLATVQGDDPTQTDPTQVARLTVFNAEASPLSDFQLHLEQFTPAISSVLDPLMNTLSLPGEVCIRSSVTGSFLDGFFEGLGHSNSCFGKNMTKPKTYGLFDLLINPEAYSAFVRMFPSHAHVTSTDESSFVVMVNQTLPNPSPIRFTLFPFHADLSLLGFVPNVKILPNLAAQCALDAFVANMGHTKFLTGPSYLDDDYFEFVSATNVTAASEATVALMKGKGSTQSASLVFSDTFKLAFSLKVPDWEGLFVNRTTAQNPFPIDFTLQENATLSIGGAQYQVVQDTTIARRVRDEDGGPFVPQYSRMLLTPFEGTASEDHGLSIPCPLEPPAGSEVCFFEVIFEEEKKK